MSKALKPIRLDLDPNSSDAAKQWKHWKRTFDNFIEECGETAPDRFRSIVNFISAEVFDYVEDCTTYDAVIETLERLFVKTPNKIFARHDLATRKQQPGESLDEFLEELKKLSKHCGFTAVTSETYRSEMIRDSFINGLTSNYIRQRLLENSELSLDRAYEIARTLHTAQKNSELYIQQSPRQIPSNVVAASISDQSTLHTNPDQESLAAVRKQTPAKRSCYFCGGFLVEPKFYQSQNSKLVKATRPMERLSIDFKGPLPSSSRNKFFLTVVDEYSRFPFAIPCPNVASETVIKCLEVIFSLCGMPEFIHSDRGSSFMSEELISFLRSRGIASSRSTPYHPIGNSQVERYNGIVWKSVRLALASVKLPVEQWERVLPDALHSIRSLLSTATNTTPHDRFFNFSRKSSQGVSLPSWLSPGPVLLRKFVRSSKNDDLVEEVELTHANPTYAHIRYKDGRESTVSLTDLAPCPRDTLNAEDATVRNHEDNVAEAGQSDTDNISTPIIENDDDNIAESVQEPRRSTRLRKKPERYGIQVDE